MHRNLVGTILYFTLGTLLVLISTISFCWLATRLIKEFTTDQLPYLLFSSFHLAAGVSCVTICMTSEMGLRLLVELCLAASSLSWVAFGVEMPFAVPSYAQYVMATVTILAIPPLLIPLPSLLPLVGEKSAERDPERPLSMTELASDDEETVEIVKGDSPKGKEKIHPEKMVRTPEDLEAIQRSRDDLDEVHLGAGTSNTSLDEE